MAADIILVAGISGVGKTTLCRWVTETHPSARHLVASSFLDGGRPLDQLTLARRIRSAALAHDGPSLVDGHLIVGGNKVPHEAITALAPKAIVVVTAEPRDILARRISDRYKVRPPLSEDEIAHLQHAELQWAGELAQASRLPLFVINDRDRQSFRSKINQMLEGH